ncbi:MAG: 23S rRNA (uracil(1939)-C(5))-methyltransferase RlmD [Candidatus Zixiibacteriota bacterium]|nr:MAG: 23S rRNA (uracil(1939)-C(5))-methyltransferase RlmD [candidate division Zixibacteria bacterium]
MDNKQVEVEITDLAFNGRAVGHLDGKVVFLDGGLPGERVLARITSSKPRYDKASVVKILKQSERRVPAVCSHFAYCGGCTWQDLTYHDQLIYKKKQVIDCLQRIGGLESTLVQEVVGSVEVFRYRNKMEFSFNADTDGSDFTLGLHRQGRFDEIFDLERCFLTSDVVSDIVRWIRDYVRKAGLTSYNVTNHAGFMRFIMIRQAKRTADLMVNVVTNYGEMPNRDRFIHEITAAFPQISTIVHNQNSLKSNIATGEIETVLFGCGYIEERLFESVFRIRANSFFQTNTVQTETLYRIGFDLLEPRPDQRVLDLYCGTGSIGILIATYVNEVVGVELVADAVQAARENAHANKMQNISFFEGDVKDYLKTCEKTGGRFDSVIVDPPRAGLHPKALRGLSKLRPEKILYISCNPSTFARDAKELVAAGYDLPEVRPVDMFPHTMHIELASVFNRK